MTKEVMKNLDDYRNRRAQIGEVDAGLVRLINKIVNSCDHKNPDDTKAYNTLNYVCQICKKEVI